MRFCVRTCLVGVLAMAVAGVSPASAQGDVPGIQVELTTLTDRLMPMQPIRLIVRVANVSVEPVRGWFILHANAGRCGLMVEGEGLTRHVNSREMTPNRLAAGDYLPPARPMTYEPGYERTLDLIALYDRDAADYLFPIPGRYDLRFWVQFFTGTGLDDYKPVHLISDTVSLNIEEPEGERFASRVWRLPWGMPQQFSGSPVTSGFSDVSGTSYEQYARFAMSGWSEIARAERIRILEELADGPPPQQIADLVMLRLAELLLAENDHARAAEWARKVEEMPGALPHVVSRAAQLRQEAERRD